MFAVSGSKGAVLFGGSRNLISGEVVGSVVGAALAAGFQVRAGCARGADALVVSSVVAAGAASRLSVFCAFPGFGGRVPAASDQVGVLAAARAGASVFFSSFCGPDRAVLAARSRSAVAGARFCCWFLSPSGAAAGSSSGSLLAAAFAVRCGRPVFVFACGFWGPPPLLSGCAGSWVRVQLWGFPVWRWLPDQLKLSKKGGEK
jgi:hypothetical protein